MATMQMSRTPLQQKSWEAIFTNEQVSEQMSALFVKKILAVAISSVTYLRAIFPEHAFGDKCLEDLNLKVLRDESSCPGACQVIKWVKGCFDALDKKYLKTLVLGVFTSPNDPETLIESFTFKFSYKSHGGIDIYRNDEKLSSAYSSEETKKATIMLLRTLVILTNTLKPLPENVMMTMKLFYFDEVTPSDYEPPGFKSSNDNNFQFLEDVTNIAIGEVSTIHQPTAVNDNCHQEIDTTNCNQEKDLTKKAAEEAQTEDEFPVRCPCGCNEDDGLMIMCSVCNTWQHGICFLITDENKAPGVHICEQCTHGNPDTEPTDPYLKDMSPVAIQATCLWRRTLIACLEFKRVIAPHLARRLGVEITVAQGLINRLEKEGFVSHSNKSKKLGKTVNKEKIKSDGIPCYLKTPKTLQKKSLDQTSSMECPMEETIVNAPDNGISLGQNIIVKVQENKNVKTAVDSLADKTNKINLEDKKRQNHRSTSLVKSQDSDFAHPSGRHGRKRAHSRLDNSEFELSGSQECETKPKRKKASVVKKQLAV